MAAGLLAFFIALFASLVLVEPARALAIRVGMVDLPGPRKVHHAPIPLLGGLPIYAAVVIAVLLSFHGPARTQIAGILIGAKIKTLAKINNPLVLRIVGPLSQTVLKEPAHN